MFSSNNHLVRTITVAGYKVDIMKFGKQSFYYPQFNGDAEFKVNSKGFRQLHSYLRTVTWGADIVRSCQRRINISLTQSTL